MMKLNIQKFALSKSTTFSEPTLTDAMISGNYSTLKITIKFSANNSVTYFNSKTLKCTCNGVQKSASVSLSKGGSITKTFTYENISHDNDGTKSVSWSWSCNTGTSTLGTVSANGTKELQKIDRLAFFSGDKITGNTTTPTTLTLNYDVYNLDYTYTYSYHSPNNSYSFGSLTPTGLSGNTKNVTISNSMFNNNPNDAVLPLEIQLQTYNGTTYLGASETETINMTLDTTAIPTATIGTLAEANLAMISLNWNVYVKNKSQLSIPITANGILDSNVTSIKVTTNGETLTYTPTTPANTITHTFTTSLLKTSGTNTISVEVTDSRGRVGTTTTTFSVEDYKPPLITQVGVLRVNGSDVEDAEGTYLHYIFKGEITNVGSNDHTFRIGYKQPGDANYTYKTVENSSYTCNKDERVTDWTLSANNTYEIVFEAIDSFYTSSNPIRETRELETGFDLMNFNASGKAMAIGKVSEATGNQELLEIDLPTEITQDTTITEDLSVTGATTIGGNTTISGDASVGGDLSVTGSISGTISDIGNLANLTTTAQNNLVSAVNEVNGKIKDFVTDTFVLPISSLAAGGTKELTYNIAKSGYTPIAISGYSIGYSAMNVYILRITSDTEAQMNVRNMYTNAASNVNARIYVLYIKS